MAKTKRWRTTGATVSMLAHISAVGSPVEESRNVEWPTALQIGSFPSARSELDPLLRREPDPRRPPSDGRPHGRSRGCKRRPSNSSPGATPPPVGSRLRRPFRRPRRAAGAITARGEAHTLRLSMIYALADQSDVIQRPHLQAALAVWGVRRAQRRPHLRRDAWQPRRRPDPGRAAEGRGGGPEQDRDPRPVPAQRRRRPDRRPRSASYAPPARRDRTGVATGGHPAEVWIAGEFL